MNDPVYFLYICPTMPEIKATNYSVFVSRNISDEINKYLTAKKNVFSKLFILADENSLKYCYPQLVAAVPAFEDAEIIEIESGEKNKNIEIGTQLWSALDELGADRQSLFINLGGGVISDIGGFVASTFKRGIPFINIPTTLLSQVDASIGGKVGIDLGNIKNLVGVFNNPEVVFIDTNFLKTLGKRQLLSGFAEMIKHALIADAGYWQKIKNADIKTFNDFDSLISASIAIKNKIVQDDPFEKNSRKTLNFGHTIGHAIESYFLEQDTKQLLLHGEAIAAGMICETYLSSRITGLPSDSLKEITFVISTVYPVIPINKSDFEHLTELMYHDKKNVNKQLNFSLLSTIGKCEINQNVSLELVKEALGYYIEQSK